MARVADRSTWTQLKRLLGRSLKQQQQSTSPRLGDLHHMQSTEENNRKALFVVPIYVGLSAVIWGVYLTIRHAVDDVPEDAWPLTFIVAAVLATVCILLYIVERTRFVHENGSHRRRCDCYHCEAGGNVPRIPTIWAIALTTTFAVVVVLLSSSSSTSFVSDSVKFAWTIQLIILLYTYVPTISNTTKSVSFWVCTACAVVLSIVFETLTMITFCLERTDSKAAVLRHVVGHILLHVSVHLIGLGVGLQSISRWKTMSEAGLEAQRQASRHCRQTTVNIVQLLMPMEVAREVVRNCLTTRRRNSDSPFGWFVMRRTSAQQR